MIQKPANQFYNFYRELFSAIKVISVKNYFPDYLRKD